MIHYCGHTFYTQYVFLDFHFQARIMLPSPLYLKAGIEDYKK
jgi:hypothetical protein